MTVYQLNRDELIELKQRYYFEKHTDVSYYEIAFIDTLVTDYEIYEKYKDTIFTEDDFFCISDNKDKKEENYEEEI